MSTLSSMWSSQSSGERRIEHDPGRQPCSRMSSMVRSTCSLASGWKVIQVAPALAKSGTIRSTGFTIRCTSIGAVTPCLAQRLADQRPDREVRHVVVVHHVEMDDVGAGRRARRAPRRRAARNRPTGSTGRSTAAAWMGSLAGFGNSTGRRRLHPGSAIVSTLQDAARCSRGLEHRLRQAVRDQLVRVILAHEPAIRERDLGIGRAGSHAEHLVGVGQPARGRPRASTARRRAGRSACAAWPRARRTRAPPMRARRRCAARIARDAGQAAAMHRRRELDLRRTGASGLADRRRRRAAPRAPNRGEIPGCLPSL